MQAVNDQQPRLICIFLPFSLQIYEFVRWEVAYPDNSTEASQETALSNVEVTRVDDTVVVRACVWYRFRQVENEVSKNDEYHMYRGTYFRKCFHFIGPICGKLTSFSPPMVDDGGPRSRNVERVLYSQIQSPTPTLFGY